MKDRSRGRAPVRPLAMGLAIGLLVTAASPLAVTAQEDAPDPTVCEGKSIAFATVQPRGDNSVVDDSYDGLQRTISELGAANAIMVEALDPATYESTLVNVANAGNGIIVANFPGMIEPMRTVAQQFPDVRFVHLYSDPADPVIPNLRSVSYDYYHAAYLSGIMAGHLTETGTIGFEAGVFIPPINADYHAFAAGAHTVDPEIEVIAGEVGSFSDDAKAKEVVSAIIAQGADVVFGDGPTVGLIEAAKEKGAFMLQGIPSLIEQAPELMPGIPFVSFGQSTFDEVAAACADEWTGGHVNSGLGDGAVDFFVADEFLAAGDPALVAKVQAALPAVEEARAAIAAGELEVPFITENP